MERNNPGMQRCPTWPRTIKQSFIWFAQWVEDEEIEDAVAVALRADGYDSRHALLLMNDSDLQRLAAAHPHIKPGHVLSATAAIARVQAKHGGGPLADAYISSTGFRRPQDNYRPDFLHDAKTLPPPPRPVRSPLLPTRDARTEVRPHMRVDARFREVQPNHLLPATDIGRQVMHCLEVPGFARPISPGAGVGPAGYVGGDTAAQPPLPEYVGPPELARLRLSQLPPPYNTLYPPENAVSPRRAGAPYTAPPGRDRSIENVESLGTEKLRQTIHHILGQPTGAELPRTAKPQPPTHSLGTLQPMIVNTPQDSSSLYKPHGPSGDVDLPVSPKPLSIARACGGPPLDEASSQLEAAKLSQLEVKYPVQREQSAQYCQMVEFRPRRSSSSARPLSSDSENVDARMYGMSIKGHVMLHETSHYKAEPTEQDIIAYAERIGIDPDEEPELMWIAQEGLKEPVPEHWTRWRDPGGEVYFLHSVNGERILDDPRAAVHKQRVAGEKQRLESRIRVSQEDSFTKYKNDPTEIESKGKIKNITFKN